MVRTVAPLRGRARYRVGQYTHDSAGHSNALAQKQQRMKPVREYHVPEPLMEAAHQWLKANCKGLTLLHGQGPACRFEREADADAFAAWLTSRGVALKTYDLSVWVPSAAS